MLRFEIKGSAKNPYIVTAEGSGDDLFIKCTCPAWRMGGQFCKHAAAILMADVSHVVSGIDDVPKLIEAAQGTSYATAALKHNPKAANRVEGIDNLAELIRVYKSDLEANGWTVEHEPTVAPSKDERVNLFKSYKNGKRYKNPKIILAFEEWSYDWVAQPDGSVVQENKRPSVRPWRVAGRSYGSLATAIPEFLKQAGISPK